eukprot:scaffold2268_cov349-Prasinococcus_capsulatus_cf.AAC.14
MDRQLVAVDDDDDAGSCEVASVWRPASLLTARRGRGCSCCCGCPPRGRFAGSAMWTADRSRAVHQEEHVPFEQAAPGAAHERASVARPRRAAAPPGDAGGGSGGSRGGGSGARPGRRASSTRSAHRQRRDARGRRQRCHAAAASAAAVTRPVTSKAAARAQGRRSAVRAGPSGWGRHVTTALRSTEPSDREVRPPWRRHAPSAEACRRLPQASRARRDACVAGGRRVRAIGALGGARLQLAPALHRFHAAGAAAPGRWRPTPGTTTATAAATTTSNRRRRW